LFLAENNMVDDGEGVVEAHKQQEILPQQFVDATAPSVQRYYSCSRVLNYT